MDKNIDNNDHNLNNTRVRVFIFYMGIPFILMARPFNMIFDLVTLTLKLDQLLKTLILAIHVAFKGEEVGLSYCTCALLVTRPFTWYHDFYAPGMEFRGI